MGDLHEIVDIGTIGKLFAVLALVCPLAGGALGALIGARRSNLKGSALAGSLIGSLAILNWLLWRGYNALTERNGLDSVKNLAINLALFIVVGILIGAAGGWMRSRNWFAPHAAAEPPEDSAGNAR